MLSNAFVATALLPRWLGVIAEWNPLSATATRLWTSISAVDPSHPVTAIDGANGLPGVSRPPYASPDTGEA